MNRLQLTSSIIKRSARKKKVTAGSGDSSREISIRGGWVYRIRYVDPDGQPRTKERGFWRTKNEAKDARDIAIRELEKSHGQIRIGEKMTFAQLAERCKLEFYKPAVLREGKKISGVRSSRQTRSQIDNLVKYFGQRLLNSITLNSLTKYKEYRTSQPRGTAKSEEAKRKKVSISTVNRELAAMSKMMRYAYREGWVLKDVFYNAGVIEAASENARDVTVSMADERALLDCCEGQHEVTCKRVRGGKEEEFKMTVNSDNPLLKTMIILALDSGMRRGEILKLRWDDIDFANDVIRIVGTHTKTERERRAPLSARAKAELERIKLISRGDRPFPITDAKTAFNTAVRRAGLTGLRFHDLRRTFITRQLASGMSPLLVAKVAGHTQLQTTMKHYTAVGSGEIQQIADSINEFNRVADSKTVMESEAVN